MQKYKNIVEYSSDYKERLCKIFVFWGFKMCNKTEDLKEVDCEGCSGVRDRGRYRFNDEGEEEVHCMHAGGFIPVPKVKQSEVCQHLKKS